MLTSWAFFRIEDITGAWHFATALWNPGAGDAVLTYPELYLSNVTLLALVIGVLGSLNVHALLGQLLSLPTFTAEAAPKGPWAVAQLAGLAILFVGVVYAWREGAFRWS